jgi:hypothetical protein
MAPRLLSRSILQDPVALMQDICPFPRGPNVDHLRILLISFCPNVAGIELALCFTFGIIGQDIRKVSVVHLYGVIISDIT